MKWLRPSEHRDLVLDWVFLGGVLFKALDGVAELAAGIPALFISHVQLVALVRALTAGELAEDPHDLIANFVLHVSSTLSPDAMLIAGVYLVVHGAVKLAIVTALLLGSRRIYPWVLGALGVLLVVQIVDLALRFSVGVLLLTALDVVIIWLTAREWRHRRTLRDVVRLRMPGLARMRSRRGATAGPPQSARR
nr:DUF2127 domain-containing protein [Microbacterium bovistercoris]